MGQHRDDTRSHEEDWWCALYDTAEGDVGPAVAADSLDERFDSTVDALPLGPESPDEPGRGDDPPWTDRAEAPPAADPAPAEPAGPTRHRVRRPWEPPATDGGAVGGADDADRRPAVPVWPASPAIAESPLAAVLPVESVPTAGSSAATGPDDAQPADSTARTAAELTAAESADPVATTVAEPTAPPAAPTTYGSGVLTTAGGQAASHGPVPAGGDAEQTSEPSRPPEPVNRPSDTGPRATTSRPAGSGPPTPRPPQEDEPGWWESPPRVSGPVSGSAWGSAPGVPDDPAAPVAGSAIPDPRASAAPTTPVAPRPWQPWGGPRVPAAPGTPDQPTGAEPATATGPAGSAERGRGRHPTPSPGEGVEPAPGGPTTDTASGGRPEPEDAAGPAADVAAGPSWPVVGPSPGWPRTDQTAGAPSAGGPVELPPADPETVDHLVPDTLLEGARYDRFTLRVAAVRGDAARQRGANRRDVVLTARFGTGDDALILVVAGRGGSAGEQARLAAAPAAAWLARLVGRNRVPLVADLRAGRRGTLQAGLQRLTARGFGRFQDAVAESEPDRAAQAATLRCLLIPTDPRCTARVFLGVGAGGFLRLRDGRWRDLESDSGQPADASAPTDLRPPGPPGDRSGDQGGPTDERPLRFRYCQARPGDVLLLGTEGLAAPVRDDPRFAAALADRWAGTAASSAAPALAEFLADVERPATGHREDRTAVAVWQR